MIKSKKLKHFCQLTFLSLSFALPSSLRAETIKLATFDYPPLFHTGATGEFSGTVGETVKYMCKKAELNCEVEVLPFKRAYQKLENKLVDGLITIKVRNFTKCCIPTDWETPWVAGFFSHKDITDIPKLPDEVIGERLIVVSGMQSPYEFMPKLDSWDKEKKLTLFKANDVFSATRMFLNQRAPYLWGSEDFNWYFNKQRPQENFNFLPLIVRPIVVWVQHDNLHVLNKLNYAYKQLMDEQVLDHKKLLNRELMSERYIDAPFDY